MTEAPLPRDFDVDEDPPTAEDGRGNNVDQPLPDVDPDEYLDSDDAPPYEPGEGVEL